MGQHLLLVFPIPVALALAALVLVVACLVRVLASLGRPMLLRAPPDEHEPTDPSEHELRTH